MGLDITVYSGLKPAPPGTELDVDGGTGWRPGPAMKWSEENWPGRGEGLDADQIYTFEKTYGFAAGAYSIYGQWRRGLARFADQIEEGTSPFFELIHFADNEGVIGPVVSAKLAKDFRDNYERAKAFGDGYWLSKYEKWMAAFEMAADNGAVEFH